MTEWSKFVAARGRRLRQRRRDHARRRSWSFPDAFIFFGYSDMIAAGQHSGLLPCARPVLLDLAAASPFSLRPNFRPPPFDTRWSPWIGFFWKTPPLTNDFEPVLPLGSPPCSVGAAAGRLAFDFAASDSSISPAGRYAVDRRAGLPAPDAGARHLPSAASRSLGAALPFAMLTAPAPRHFPRRLVSRNACSCRQPMSHSAPRPCMHA